MRNSFVPASHCLLCVLILARSAFRSSRHATHCNGVAPSPHDAGTGCPVREGWPCPTRPGELQQDTRRPCPPEWLGWRCRDHGMWQPNVRRAPLPHAETLPGVWRPRGTCRPGIAQQSHDHGVTRRGPRPPARDGWVPPLLKGAHEAGAHGLDASDEEVRGHATDKQRPGVLAHKGSPALRRRTAAWSVIKMRGHVLAYGAWRDRRPNLSSSSLAIRRWPQVQLSRAICRMSVCSAPGIEGRPGYGVQCQNSRNPWRRHRLNVSGCTTAKAGCQSNHCDSQTRLNRVASLARRGLTLCS